MKKIVLSLMVMVMVFALTGCFEKKGNEKTNNDKPKEVEKNIKVGDYAFALDKEDNNKNLYYKYSSDFNIGGYNNMSFLNYGEEGNQLFDIRIIYFENQNLDDMMKEVIDSGTEIFGETISDIAWKVFTQNGVKTYMTINDDDVYSITFKSSTNIDNLEKEFMNNIVFK